MTSITVEAPLSAIAVAVGLGGLAGVVVNRTATRWCTVLMSHHADERTGEAPRPAGAMRFLLEGVVLGTSVTVPAISLIVFGVGLSFVAVTLFCVAVTLLATIDLRTGFLPDAITLPLLWTGLLVNACSLLVSPELSIWGAAFGYGLPWLAAQIHNLRRGQDGIGYGDMKMAAAIGAWVGIYGIPWALFIATVSAVGVLLVMSVWRRELRHMPQAFGPWLAAGAITAILFRLHG